EYLNSSTDLAVALESGKIKSFATDFPTPRQMRMKNVVFTPHLAAGTPEADVNCAVMAAREMIDYIENGNITNSVNMPDVSFARANGARVCIFHENKVGMLGKITDVVTGMKLNIENLVNKGRGNIAYTILDFNTEVPVDLGAPLKAIDGVIRVRVIE
ncbi:MAG: 3-phosphoglycerate dehydrogenase, partial [Clostridia bacterium]|nr:3-phosphoglycerate dehydrogenase [Clostridia bacterium]